MKLRRLNRNKNVDSWLIFVLIVLICMASLAFGRDNYYRLDDYDSSYNKLEDEPLPPSKDKQLHPSSIYKQERPPRIEKTPDYSRRDIPSSTQVSNRLENKKISPNKKGYLFLGANGGLDLYSYDSKRKLSLEVMGKIGYWHYLNLNSFRIYFQLGGRFPLNNENSNTLALNLNMDFLVNIKVFDFYIGAGYGGEYYFSQKYFSNGFHINTGISKSFGRHSLEFGLVIPFYTIYVDNEILKNNIIFMLGYNYKI